MRIRLNQQIRSYNDYANFRVQGKYMQIVAVTFTEKMLINFCFWPTIFGCSDSTTKQYVLTLRLCFIYFSLRIYIAIVGLDLSSLLSIYSTFFLNLFHILSLLLTSTDGGLGLFSNNERAQGEGTCRQRNAGRRYRG